MAHINNYDTRPSTTMRPVFSRQCYSLSSGDDFQMPDPEAEDDDNDASVTTSSPTPLIQTSNGALSALQTKESKKG